MWQKLWQWFMKRISKKPVEPVVLKSTYTGPAEPVVAEIRKAKAKRERRRMRNLNDKTKGAFGNPNITPHYSSMKGPVKFKRDRGD